MAPRPESRSAIRSGIVEDDTALLVVFMFAVPSAPPKLEFSLDAGFGLFAILAFFAARSEPVATTEFTSD